MDAMFLPSNSLDKNYLFRLLNGNTEMMDAVLTKVFQNIPYCISEIEMCLRANDTPGVLTYVARAKSALSLIREDQLLLAFDKIELTAKKGEIATIDEFVHSTFSETLSKMQQLKEAV